MRVRTHAQHGIGVSVQDLGATYKVTIMDDSKAFHGVTVTFTVKKGHAWIARIAKAIKQANYYELVVKGLLKEIREDGRADGTMPKRPKTPSRRTPKASPSWSALRLVK